MNSWSEGTPNGEPLRTPSADFSPTIVPRQNTPPSLLQAPSPSRVPSYSSSGGTGQAGTATYRRTAWDNSSESAPMRSNEIFTDNFPYPSYVSSTGHHHRVTEDNRNPHKASTLPLNQTGLMPRAPERQVPPLGSDCDGGNGCIPHRSPQHGNVRRRGAGPGSPSSEATRNLETCFNSRRGHGRQTRNNNDHESRPDKEYHRDIYGPGISPICRRNTWSNQVRNGYENRPNFPGDAIQGLRGIGEGSSGGGGQEGSNGGGGGWDIEDGAYDRRGRYDRLKRPEEYSASRTVDGEAYHFRSFSEEVSCTWAVTFSSSLW